MGMAPHHLLIDGRTHVVYGELARLGCDLALQNHLEQYVAELLFDAPGIPRLDRVGRLVGFLHQVLG